MANYRIFETVDDLLRAAARTIVQQVKGGARTVALSGGSTPKPMFAMLGSAPFREELAQYPVTWVVVDERYVPLDDAESNAGAMQKTLFAAGLSESHRFLRFRTELGDPAATAAEFEREWRALGIETLDVAVLGIGDDGHTASLFPGTPILDVDDRIAGEVFVQRLDAWRVTITRPVIRDAKLRIVLVAGASKEPVLRQLREGADYPIGRVTAGVETWWLIDRAAAGKETEEPER
jgi:6-phosphogluconolactonase